MGQKHVQSVCAIHSLCKNVIFLGIYLGTVVFIKVQSYMLNSCSFTKKLLGLKNSKLDFQKNNWNFIFVSFWSHDNALRPCNA